MKSVLDLQKSLNLIIMSTDGPLKVLFPCKFKNGDCDCHFDDTNNRTGKNKNQKKESNTELTASVQKNKPKHTRGYKNERLLVSTRQKQCANFRHTLPLTNRQTDMEREFCLTNMKICGGRSTTPVDGDSLPRHFGNYCRRVELIRLHFTVPFAF